MIVAFVMMLAGVVVLGSLNVAAGLSRPDRADHAIAHASKLG